MCGLKHKLRFTGKDFLDKFCASFELSLVLLNQVPQICPAFVNSLDPDHLAFEKANWSGSALFVTKYKNLYQQAR